MIKIVDDRPKNWESPDGNSFWWHYAHSQDRLRDTTDHTIRWIFVGLVLLLSLVLLIKS